jgi:hypothetical protein
VLRFSREIRDYRTVSGAVRLSRTSDSANYSCYFLERNRRQILFVQQSVPFPPAGTKAEERPVRFQLDERDYMVEEVLDQW